MRILILTQWFDPEPTFKGLAFARALTQLGHEVRVITGFPNYPGGKVYPGYRIRPWKKELLEGVHVTRVMLFPSHGRSAFGRVLNYVSFAASAALAGILSRFRPDVMYVYHPPLTVGLAALVIHVFRQVPFVYDIQDLWPDTLAATGMIRSKRILTVIGSLSRWVNRRATRIIAQSPGFVARLLDQGVPAKKIRLIYNWCDEQALSQRAREPAFDVDVLGDRFNVVFAGNMGKAQALDSVLEAARLVAEVDGRIQWVFVGSGTEVDSLQDQVRGAGMSSVVFVPRLPMDEIGYVLDAADALLVHLRDEPLFTITLPSKTQAYLYAGRPIIMGVRGNAAELVTQAGAGVCVRPEDPRSIADGVLQLAELSPAARSEMGRRGRRFYDETMSLESGARQMVESLEDAINAAGPGGIEGSRG